MNEYNKIVNPKTNSFVNIYSKTGRKILYNYLIQLGGHQGPCSYNKETGRCHNKGPNNSKQCEVSEKKRCKMTDEWKKNKKRIDLMRKRKSVKLTKLKKITKKEMDNVINELSTYPNIDIQEVKEFLKNDYQFDPNCKNGYWQRGKDSINEEDKVWMQAVHIIQEDYNDGFFKLK